MSVVGQQVLSKNGRWKLTGNGLQNTFNENDSTMINESWLTIVTEQWPMNVGRQRSQKTIVSSWPTSVIRKMINEVGRKIIAKKMWPMVNHIGWSV